MKLRLPWFRRKVDVPDYAGDPAAWLMCWEEGHVSVNDIDGWLCVRCWTGFFMGMGFAIKEETREEFRDGTLAIWYNHWWHYGQAEFRKGEPAGVSLAERLTAGPDTAPPSKGGPPYVFELKRAR